MVNEPKGSVFTPDSTMGEILLNLRNEKALKLNNELKQILFPQKTRTNSQSDTRTDLHLRAQRLDEMSRLFFLLTLLRGEEEFEFYDLSDGDFLFLRICLSPCTGRFSWDGLFSSSHDKKKK